MPSRAVLVTGGTGALGSEIVRALTRSTPDSTIIANYQHDAARAARLQHETGCVLYRADISDEAQVTAMFDELPPLFAVIHAAGVARDSLLLRQSRAGWDETQAVNLDGAFLVAREALQKLQDGGRLIFLASRVGEVGNVGQSAYAASKGGVLALMKCAAREGAARRLAVNAICPGFVVSEMNQNLSTPALEAARKASVFGEFGEAREAGSLVRWLLSEEAGAVSGQVFHCDSRLLSGSFEPEI